VPEHVPQHDPSPDAGLVQPEVKERHDSVVVDGDDRDHVLPPNELEPYTPEASRGGPRIALWIGLAVLVAVAIVIAVWR
jgi:hypothetical protein